MFGSIFENASCFPYLLEGVRGTMPDFAAKQLAKYIGQVLESSRII